MAAASATCVYAGLILWLYWLDRDATAKTSKAMWVPVLWLALSGSRSVAQWLGMDPIVSADQVLEGSPVDRLVYTSMLTVGVAVLLRRGKAVQSLLRANAPIIVFFLYCAMSLLWSEFPGVAFKRWTKALGDFVMILVVLSEVEPVAAIKRLLSWTAFLLIPLSVLLIKYFPDIGRGYGKWDGRAIFLGVTTNKNTLGVICLLFGLGSLWRVLEAYRDRGEAGRAGRLIAHGTILSMVLWLFWIANSMTSLVCFISASALLIVSRSGFAMRSLSVVHVLVVGILGVCVSILFVGVDLGVLSIIGRDPTLTDRTEIWPVFVQLVDNPLVGSGFESFWLGSRLETIWSMYAWRPSQAHNGYLEVFLNLGWIGVMLLSIVIAMGYRTVLSAYRHDPRTGSLMLAFFAMGLIYNLTEAAFFRMMAPAWVCWLLAIANFPVGEGAKGRMASTEIVPGAGDNRMRTLWDQV